MGSEKFTGGEWFVTEVDGHEISLDSETGLSLATIFDDYESDIANAYLMAAAPSMYNLLVLMQIEGGLGAAKHKRIAEVIAKARGES